MPPLQCNKAFLDLRSRGWMSEVPQQHRARNVFYKEVLYLNTLLSFARFNVKTTYYIES